MTKAIHLSDYTPFSHIVERVDLAFRLHPTATRVSARLALAPNPERPGQPNLRLDGEGLRLIRAAVDGTPITVTPDETGLTIPASLLPDAPFLLETEVEIAPQANTALEGLYMSNGMYCTQCEAEGFRKITFYPDRPDVMAPFRVRIESRPAGAAVERQPHGPGAGLGGMGRPLAQARLPFRAGGGRPSGPFRPLHHRLGARGGTQHLGPPGDEGKCAYAMEALKRSMRWDERPMAANTTWMCSTSSRSMISTWARWRTRG
jgi:aminopeptidase N